jgi:hypothetical protein
MASLKAVMNKRKLKKLQRMKRNRKIQLIMLHAAQHQEVQDQVRDDDAKRCSPKEVIKNDENKEIWSAKTQKIKNKLTGKKRKAKDRWNRFSGTAGGGGKGR